MRGFIDEEENTKEPTMADLIAAMKANTNAVNNLISKMSEVPEDDGKKIEDEPTDDDVNKGE